MTTPEGTIKKDIKHALDQAGVYWTMVPGGAFGRNGEPDMIACCDGRYIAIEVKTPTGVQSDWQKLRQSQIEGAGGIYVLARGVDDVMEVISDVRKA